MPGNSKDQEWRALYFQPGQIMFHLTGTATEDSTKILIDEANRLAKSKDLEITSPRTQHYPPIENYSNQEVGSSSGDKKRNPFSLVFADVHKRGKRLGDEEDDLQSLLDLIFLLDDELARPPNAAVQVVSPNWLTSGSSRPGGTGGPGGKPSPYTGSSDNTEYAFQFSKSLPQPYSNYLTPDCDTPVVVAILDTAPDRDQLDEIYNDWGLNKKHPLIRTMLDPDHRLLDVYNNPLVATPPIKDYQCIEHDYDMNDHGLFVAGIIHSLAPHAELHLYQVLNRYGVGDLEMIASTLAKVLNQFVGKPLVVNLSLNYSMPLERAHTKLGKPHISDILGEMFIEAKGVSWLKRAAKPAELILNLFHERNSGIIAAAGNDYDNQEPGSPRPQARYPAAFDRVVGVGALARGRKGIPGKAASYSNLADRPPKSGITTLGGEAGPGNGVLGTYIGKFPGDTSQPGSENHNGWAWWSGTSFATPIISGLVAAALSCLLSENPQATAQDAIDLVFSAQKESTRSGEDVFLVTQGSSP